MYKWTCFILVLALSAISLGFASNICDNAPCEPQINASLGKQFVISLDSNPGSTGFEWWLKFDPLYLSLDNATFVSGNIGTRLTGVTGKEIFTFTAEKVGNTDLLMLYLQPWVNGTIGQRKIFPIVISE